MSDEQTIPTPLEPMAPAIDIKPPEPLNSKYLKELQMYGGNDPILALLQNNPGDVRIRGLMRAKGLTFPKELLGNGNAILELLWNSIFKPAPGKPAATLSSKPGYRKVGVSVQGVIAYSVTRSDAVTFRGDVDVPVEVCEEGDDAIVDWLRDNPGPLRRLPFDVDDSSYGDDEETERSVDQDTIEIEESEE